MNIFIHMLLKICGPGSSVGIATDYGLDGPGIESRWGEIFPRPDRPWDPPSLLYNEYRFFPRGKVRPRRPADHSPPSSAVVMEEYNYTSTHPLGHTKACNEDTLALDLALLYVYLYLEMYIHVSCNLLLINKKFGDTVYSTRTLN